jgi:hypothetical protein
MKKSLPLVAARDQIAERNRIEEENARMTGRGQAGRRELGCGEPEKGAPPARPSALALLAALDAEREKRRGRSRWVPGGTALAGASPAGGGKEDLSCNCAPMAPEGLVDLEPEELSGAAGKAPAPPEPAGPVPIYNAPALAPTEASRRESISGSPVYAKVNTRPATGDGAAARPLPLGLMALATGGPTRGKAGRAVGQTPTTPPAPVPSGPPARAPFPPPTYQSPRPGLIPVWPGREREPRGGGPGGRMAPVDQAQTRRFRRMAEEAIVVVRDAAGAGDGTAEGRLAAAALRDCMGALTASIGDFGLVVARLRRADAAGAGAVLLLDEVEALEAFASCARGIVARRKGI